MRHAGRCLSPAEIYKACHIPDEEGLAPCLCIPPFPEDTLGRVKLSVSVLKGYRPSQGAGLQIDHGILQLLP